MPGSDWIEIHYLDDCSIQKTFRVTLETEKITDIEKMVVLDHKSCDFQLTLSTPQLNNCNINYSATVLDMGSNTSNASVIINNDNKIIDYSDVYFAEYLNLKTNADCSYCLNEKTLTGLIAYFQDVTVSDIIISNSVIVGSRLIYYTAGNRILLKDGFSVPAGSTLSVKIQTCIE